MPQEYVSSIEEVAAAREDLGREGRKLVLTNGAFDLLHVGHVRYLREAAALGDCLVVAINGDDSVRELKGEGRPVNSVEDRAEMLCALEFVDRVVVFEERRATGVIEAIQPHIYTKGGDYTADSLIDEEKALLDRLGIQIQILSLIPGKSTSETLKQMSVGKDAVKNVAVLGSGKGSNAEAMMRASAEGRLGGEVALILTDVPDAGILDHAEAFGVPGIVIDPGTTKGGQLTDAAIKEILDRLQAASIDIVVLAGFMRIVREPLLSAFEGRILNVHPSLLPKYPGLRAIERAIEAGDSVAGCTIHLIDSGMDTGEILRQEEVPVESGDTPEVLQARINDAEHRAYPEVVAELLAAL